MFQAFPRSCPCHYYFETILLCSQEGCIPANVYNTQRQTRKQQLFDSATLKEELKFDQDLLQHFLIFLIFKIERSRIHSIECSFEMPSFK